MNGASAIFSVMELEVIVLKAVWDMIDEMVNFELLEPLQSTNDTSLRFRTSTHQRFFNIQLVDFLSRPGSSVFGLPHSNSPAPQTDKTYLYCLQAICANPQFGNIALASLDSAVNEFKGWLEAECRIEKVWLPSIQTETTIKVSRVSFIRICGNISKHNFSRLDRDAARVRRILSESGVTSLTDTDAYLVLPEFYEWFHDHVFSYHSSAIAEFLNNIRWGIYEYLQEEFHRSFTREPRDAIKYHFNYPVQCEHPFAQQMYWNLMNDVRRAPYMPKFVVTPYLKMRY